MSENSMGWAKVEIMGHRVYYGRVTEVTVAGAGFLRIDVYRGDDEEPVASPMCPPTSVYMLTPCTEEVARAAAANGFAPAFTRVALPAHEYGADEGESDDYGDDIPV